MRSRPSGSDPRGEELIGKQSFETVISKRVLLNTFSKIHYTRSKKALPNNVI